MLGDMRNIFHEIAYTNSRNKKIELVEREILNRNKEFISLLEFLFDFRIVTGISTKKINKKLTRIKASVKFDDYSEVLNYLKRNNTGSDAVIANIRFFIDSLPDEQKRFMSSIVTKTIKIGLDVKSINHAFRNICHKDLVPQYECMLAFKYQDNKEYIEGKNFTVTTKHDGIRVNVFKQNGAISFFTRKGQPIFGLLDIEEELSKISIDNFVLDGELMVCNYTSMNSSERYKATTKLVRKDGEKHGVKILVFDFIPLVEFERHTGVTLYDKRRDILCRNFSELNYIEVLPSLYVGNDVNEIEKQIELAVQNGEEGVMINVNDAPYSFVRTKNLLKYKKWQDCDILCVGVEEGTGENEDKLGAIIVRFPFNGEMYECRCGTGFSASNREYYWNNQKDIIGKIVTIKYFEISKNDQGGYGLRFPVFKDVTDKEEISMN